MILIPYLECQLISKNKNRKLLPKLMERLKMERPMEKRKINIKLKKTRIRIQLIHRISPIRNGSDRPPILSQLRFRYDTRLKLYRKSYLKPLTETEKEEKT